MTSLLMRMMTCTKKERLEDAQEDENDRGEEEGVLEDGEGR